MLLLNFLLLNNFPGDNSVQSNVTGGHFTSGDSLLHDRLEIREMLACKDMNWSQLKSSLYNKAFMVLA